MARAKKSTVSLEELCNVAEEFNSIMEFENEDGIPFDEMNEEELKDEIIETAGELVEDDVISSKTAEILKKLKVKFEATIDLPEEDQEEDEPEDDDDEQDEEEEVEATPLKGAEAKEVKAAIAAVKKSRKMDAIKKIAKENGVRIPPPFLKDIKKLKTYVIGKLEDILSGEAAVKKAAPKKEKKNKMTIGSFFKKEIPKGLKGKHEDEIVLAAKKVFPDKPYRVIGNALYAYCKSISK